jgi:hypothetical protein
LFLNNQKKNAPAITGVDYLDKKLGQRFPLKGPLKTLSLEGVIDDSMSIVTEPAICV